MVVHKLDPTAPSRALSKTLRHKAKAQGFQISPEGWVKVEDILNSPIFLKFDLTREKLEQIVKENDKRRFELDSEGAHIRACQGHSVEVNIDSMQLLTLETLPQVVVHGTSKAAWVEIQRSGLKKMQRQHIHLAAGLYGEVISGMRKNSEVLVYVDAVGVLNSGVPFYKSSNGAILTPGPIAPKFLRGEENPNNKNSRS